MSVSEAEIEQLRQLLLSQKQNRIPFVKSKKARPENEILEFFHGMPEEKRRAFIPQLRKWRKMAWDLDSEFDVRRTGHSLYAAMTLAELKKASYLFTDQMACRILADRQVPWLSEWVEYALDDSDSAYGIGELIAGLNELMDQGIIEQPASDNYALGIAYYYVGQWLDGARQSKSLVEKLRDDLPMWGEAIWRQFEVEGGGEVSLANFEKYFASKVDGGWSHAFVTLSGEGLLDRQRLLDASLEALNRGFKQYRAGWFSKFHELMEPTVAERASRTDKYCDLLASPIGPTVSLATAALKQIQKAGELDDGLLVERIEPALFAPAAKAAKGALALLAGTAKSSPHLKPSIAAAAAVSLEHPKSDVQEAGLKLIESMADHVDGPARAAISMRLEVMSPSLRNRAGGLVAAETEVEASLACDAVDIEALKRQAGKLPADLRRLAGIDIALEAIDAGAVDVPHAPFNGMDVPRLDPARQIEPIGTFEELIDQALIAVEHPDDLELVEKVLAGAMKFAADRPANQDELMAPLKRSLSRFDPDRHYYQKNEPSPRRTLQDVLMALSDARMEAIKVHLHDPRAALALRTAAMVDAIVSRQPLVQLSAPTHKGFWIDPRVLVERTDKAEQGAGTVGLADQCLALLRLAPSHRAEAASVVKGLKGEFAEALRYALGGDAKIGKTRSLWVAATRARAPFEDNDGITGLAGGPLYGADLAPAFKFAVTWEESRHGDEYGHMKLAAGDGAEFIDFGKEMISFMGHLDRPYKPADPEQSLTSVALSHPEHLRTLDSYDASDLAHYGSWVAALWPQHPEPVFALSAKAGCMMDGVIGWEPATEPLADGLILILDPDVPVGPMAVLMLARGLNALDKPAAQATVDALIMVIEDGRLQALDLGATMHDLLMGGIVVAKRWQDRLKDVARASPLTALAVKRAIERAIHPGSPKKPLRNMHAWLEVLHELCIETGEAIEDDKTRKGLEQHFTSGKVKSVAAKLLKLQPDGAQAARKAAAAIALEHRIARAERWHALMG